MMLQTKVGKRKARRRGSLRAFNLVEVVMVFGLIAIILGSFMGVMQFFMWAKDQSDRRVLATELAQSRIEFLRSIDFMTTETFVESEVRVDRNGIPREDGEFVRTTTVGTAADFTRPVTVTVSAAGKVNRPGFTVSLQSVLIDRVILD